MAEPRYYIVVTGPENWEKTAALGWSMVGMKSTRRKLALGFRPGDKIVAYYTGLKQFGAILTVESEPFEDHTRIWASADKPAEDYPFRVRTRPDLVLPPGRLVDAQPLAAAMRWTQKWPPQNWTLAFQGNIHEIPAEDFALIEGALRSALASA
jgi:predicted RNA-binding protein